MYTIFYQPNTHIQSSDRQQDGWPYANQMVKTIKHDYLFHITEYKSSCTSKKLILRSKHISYRQEIGT